MKNYAVILGVDEYTHANNLPSCANDVKAIEGLLQATEKYEILRFSGVETKDKILEEISNLLPADASDVGEVLFFFSGHGMQDADMHYILKDTNPQMISSTALNNKELDNIVRKSSPKLFVKIIDACNSGLSYIKSAGSLIPDDIVLPSKEFENCIFMCSSKQSQYSLAGNPYSKFTKVLIDAVYHTTGKTVKFSDLQNYLSDVFTREGSNQTPYFSTQCDGTEIFCNKTERVIEYLKTFNGETSTFSISEEPTEIEKINAYLKKCRSENEVRLIMEKATRIMEVQGLEDEMLSTFYEFLCTTSVPFIYHSYHEDESIVKMLHKRPSSENLFIDIEYASVKEDTPFISWYPSYKQKPVSFISKVNQIPNVIAYHLKGKDENLPDYVIPFIFVYSPTFFYVFTCTKQFLRKGWNDYTENQGAKYTYSKFEYADFSEKLWLEYLNKRLSESMEYAKKTLLDYIS